MPNIKSSKKRVLISKEDTQRNRSVRSALKTDIRKFREAAASGDKEAAAAAAKTATSAIDKSVGKKVLPKNTAARKKSAIAKTLNQM